jgi:hypothetical protein
MDAKPRKHCGFFHSDLQLGMKLQKSSASLAVYTCVVNRIRKHDTCSPRVGNTRASWVRRRSVLSSGSLPHSTFRASLPRSPLRASLPRFPPRSLLRAFLRALPSALSSPRSTLRTSLRPHRRRKCPCVTPGYAVMAMLTSIVGRTRPLETRRVLASTISINVF